MYRTWPSNSFDGGIVLENSLSSSVASDDMVSAVTIVCGETTADLLPIGDFPPFEVVKELFLVHFGGLCVVLPRYWPNGSKICGLCSWRKLKVAESSEMD
jgi:hypothetical protein